MTATGSTAYRPSATSATSDTSDTSAISDTSAHDEPTPRRLVPATKHHSQIGRAHV